MFVYCFIWGSDMCGRAISWAPFTFDDDTVRYPKEHTGILYKSKCHLLVYCFILSSDMCGQNIFVRHLHRFSKWGFWHNKVLLEFKVVQCAQHWHKKFYPLYNAFWTEVISIKVFMNSWTVLCNAVWKCSFYQVPNPWLI